MNADEALELARKAYPNDENLRVAYMLGLNEGYELHKDKIMKEAVDGVVINSCYPTKIETNAFYSKFEHGQKVKLIIKED